MSKAWKFILYTLSAVVLIITVAELYYIFIYQPPRTQTRKTENTPTSSIGQEGGRPISQSAVIDSFQVADWERDSAMISAIRTATYEGKIVNLSTTGGFSQPLNYNYDASLEIKGTGVNNSPLYFSKKDLSSMRIIRRTSGRESDIDFADLKIGNSITIKIVTDMMKSLDDNIIEAEIVVVSSEPQEEKDQ
jgi:hypothetical protein